MEITDIKLRKLFIGQQLEAIYSVTFDNQLAVHDIKLIRKDDGYMLVMPNRKLGDGSFKDIVHPINTAFRSKIEEQIVNFHKNTALGSQITSN